MRQRFALGQAVRVNKRCVLTGRVPKNSKGYTHALLVSGEGDKYTGEGVVEAGYQTAVIDYVGHGTGTKDYPVVRVKGIAAVVHEDHLSSA